MIRMAELRTAGTPVRDPGVQAEVDTHYRGVCRFRTPTAAAFKGLGQSYVDDPLHRDLRRDHPGPGRLLLHTP
jgi:hypothetical protein